MPQLASPDALSIVDDINIGSVSILPPPQNLIRFFPIAWTQIESTVRGWRDAVAKIMRKEDDRLVVVTWPCSIHNPESAIEYAKRLYELKEKYKNTLEIIMRVYFEKPRTTVGWKWLINDPYLDESYRIEEWLRIARELLMNINSLWVPAGSEFLDVISPQYIGDLISWWAIGARTTESQVHRELASWLSAPIGFKNGTDGNLKIATDAIQASGNPHHFLSIHKNGEVAIVQTRWNSLCHVILRGGKNPNYKQVDIALACEALRQANLPELLMVDCSHGNSNKDFRNQPKVAADIAKQISNGGSWIFWVMLESHIEEGSQKFSPGKDNPKKLNPNQSITDACIGWGQTVATLDTLSKAVEARRNKK